MDKIQRYTSGMTVSEFRKNELVLDAVIRNLEIIGEATHSIPLEIQEAHCDVPWREMKAMRNFLIHEYSGVDIDTVWETLQTHLPPLKPLLLAILKSSP